MMFSRKIVIAATLLLGSTLLPAVAKSRKLASAPGNAAEKKKLVNNTKTEGKKSRRFRSHGHRNALKKVVDYRNRNALSTPVVESGETEHSSPHMQHLVCSAQNYSEQHPSVSAAADELYRNCNDGNSLVAGMQELLVKELQNYWSNSPEKIREAVAEFAVFAAEASNDDFDDNLLGVLKFKALSLLSSAERGSRLDELMKKPRSEISSAERDELAGLISAERSAEWKRIQHSIAVKWEDLKEETINGLTKRKVITALAPPVAAFLISSETFMQGDLTTTFLGHLAFAVWTYKVVPVFELNGWNKFGMYGAAVYSSIVALLYFMVAIGVLRVGNLKVGDHWDSIGKK